MCRLPYRRPNIGSNHPRDPGAERTAWPGSVFSRYQTVDAPLLAGMMLPSKTKTAATERFSGRQRPLAGQWKPVLAVSPGPVSVILRIVLIFFTACSQLIVTKVTTAISRLLLNSRIQDAGILRRMMSGLISQGYGSAAVLLPGIFIAQNFLEHFLQHQEYCRGSLRKGVVIRGAQCDLALQRGIHNAQDIEVLLVEQCVRR